MNRWEDAELFSGIRRNRINLYGSLALCWKLRKECGFKTQHELDAESGENTFEGSSFHSTEERDLLMAEFDELMHQTPDTGSANNANDSIEGEGSNQIQMDEEQLSGLYNEFIETATFLVGR